MKRCFNSKLILYTVMVIPLMMSIAIPQIYALRQPAGDIDVTIEPGKAKTFSWDLMNTNNDTMTLVLSVMGEGAQFVSLPQKIDLEPNVLTPVRGTIEIPQGFDTSKPLVATLHAETDRNAPAQTSAAVINIAVEKNVVITVTPGSKQASEMANDMNTTGNTNNSQTGTQ